MADSVSFPKVTIASSGRLSSAADLGNAALCALHMPATFTGTTVKCKGAREVATGGSVTYYYIKDSVGADLTATVSGGVIVQLDPTLFLGVRYVKVESQSDEGAARDIYLGLRAY